MAEKGEMGKEHLGGVVRLREEHEKVVRDCKSRIQHWEKVSGDYEALKDRLQTLPDQLSYDIMVPFGPLAFMPGKLVHTNEVTVLLGDNWFAKCSAKQAQKIVDHRMTYVKSELDDLSKTAKNFEARVGFAQDWETISGHKGDYVDIREQVGNDAGDDVIDDAVAVPAAATKGKQRKAHKPNSKPKVEAVLDVKEELEEDGEEADGGGKGGATTEEELWARLDELEKLEELQDEQDRLSDNAEMNGEDTTSSSSSSEEDKEGNASPPLNGLGQKPSWPSMANGKAPPAPSGDRMREDGDEEQEGNCLPSIYFSHTVEPKKVRINTGKNTTLKFSERKEQKEHSKRKKKNGQSNGHSHHEHHKISTPTDIYRLFVDVKNGEPIPRKSILKSRSRENSVCSDTSESSAADFDERRVIGRSYSHDEGDTSDGITEEDSPIMLPHHAASRFEAFSGMVVEKDPMPSAVPHLIIAPPALPTIPERSREEVAPDAAPPQEPPRRVSKFKAARLQQK
ncbi:unconventional prefoldin RPB5 interactor 1 [Genypterus blacodes]|uniref:unconventional prefoldin RPB5 interactor 1 n=1 Tax=Genypterus blacodes TaxID=154954 RepID=UPI003F76BDFA